MPRSNGRFEDEHEPHRYQVEVLYSDSIDACVIADSRVESIGDMDLEGLMQAVDRTAELAGREEAPD